MFGPTHAHRLMCPACGASLNFSTQVDGDGSLPSAGDATLCAECGTVLVFVNTATLRLADATERAEFVERVRRWMRDRES